MRINGGGGVTSRTLTEKLHCVTKHRMELERTSLFKDAIMRRAGEVGGSITAPGLKFRRKIVDFYRNLSNMLLTKRFDTKLSVYQE